MNSEIPNGGFPSIKVIERSDETKIEKDNQFKKERFFSQNLNIKDILTQQKTKPMFNTEKEEIKIITEL
jgi:hypothetical protein